MTRAIQKYLEHYAEESVFTPQLLDAIKVRSFALVIPAYKETLEFIQRLSQHASAAELSLVLVINEPISDKGNSENKALLAGLSLNGKSRYNTGKVQLLELGRLQILLIAALGESALPDKQGVGLARKIGADTACRLYILDKIRSAWIFNSDADAILPNTHFQLPDQTQISAFTHPFKHVGEQSPTLAATMLYEACLRYYRQQLEKAGSRYAFHTLGSAITISMAHYAQVRGFPKRSGAEDFYVLNKLAKVGRVVESGNAIHIHARISDRVPFGTGPAVANIEEKLHKGQAITYYASEIFDELGHLLSATRKIWEQRDYHHVLSAHAAQALTDAKFQHFLEQRLKQDKHFEQFEKNFHDWFDAFQTLKFVRRMQNNYEDIDIREHSF